MTSESSERRLADFLGLARLISGCSAARSHHLSRRLSFSHSSEPSHYRIPRTFRPFFGERNPWCFPAKESFGGKKGNLSLEKGILGAFPHTNKGTIGELSPHLSSFYPSHLEDSEDSQLGDSGESWHLDHEGHVRAQAGTISVQDFSDGYTLVRQSEIRQSLASGMETIVGRCQRPRRSF